MRGRPWKDWFTQLKWTRMTLNSMKKSVCPLATAVVALLLAGGCQRTYRPEIAPVAEYRTHGDEAMDRRDWPMTTALYGNGNVVAGPTNSNREWRIGEASDAAYGRRRGFAIVMEPLVALGTLVALPASLAMDPPTERRTYEG